MKPTFSPGRSLPKAWKQAILNRTVLILGESLESAKSCHLTNRRFRRLLNLTD